MEDKFIVLRRDGKVLLYGTSAESLYGKQVAREMAILGGLPINPPIFICCKNNQVFCKILRLTFI